MKCFITDFNITFDHSEKHNVLNFSRVDPALIISKKVGKYDMVCIRNKKKPVTSPLSLRRDSFITQDIEDFFSSPNAELCLSPTKIDGFPQSGFQGL